MKFVRWLGRGPQWREELLGRCCNCVEGNAVRKKERISKQEKKKGGKRGEDSSVRFFFSRHWSGSVVALLRSVRCVDADVEAGRELRAMVEGAGNTEHDVAGLCLCSWLDFDVALDMASWFISYSATAAARRVDMTDILIGLAARSDARAASLMAFVAQNQAAWKGSLKVTNALVQALRKAVAANRNGISAVHLATVVKTFLDHCVAAGPAQGRECRFFLSAVTELIRNCGVATVTGDELAVACCSLFAWSWASNIPDAGKEHVGNIVTGASKLALVLQETCATAFVPALAARCSTDLAAHQLLAMLMARDPTPVLMQCLFDGITLHATALLESEENVTRTHLSLCGAILRISFGQAERWLFQNVVVQHPLAAHVLTHVWAFALRRAKVAIQVGHLQRLLEVAALMAASPSPVMRKRVLRIFKGLALCMAPATIGALIDLYPDALSHLLPSAHNESVGVPAAAAAVVSRSAHSINQGGDALFEFTNLLRLGASHLEPAVAASILQSVQEVYLRSGPQERRSLPHLISSLAGWCSRDQIKHFFQRIISQNGRTASPTTNMLLLTHMMMYLEDVTSWKPLFASALGGRDWLAMFAAGHFFALLSTQRLELQQNDLRSLVGAHRDFIMTFMSAANRPRSITYNAEYCVFSSVAAKVMTPPLSSSSSSPPVSMQHLETLLDTLEKATSSLCDGDVVAPNYNYFQSSQQARSRLSHIVQRLQQFIPQ